MQYFDRQENHNQSGVLFQLYILLLSVAIALLYPFLSIVTKLIMNKYLDTPDLTRDYGNIQTKHASVLLQIRNKR